MIPFEYEVKKSFWVKPNSQINWNATAYGREGVGIPTSLIPYYDELIIFVKNRNKRYKVKTKDILEYEKEWDTLKTAPEHSYNKFIIMPVSLMIPIENKKEQQ